MGKFSYLIIALLLACSVQAKRGAVSSNPNDPWSTGPLICPSSRVTSSGEVNLEPYYYLLIQNGRYNSDWVKVRDIRSLHSVFELYFTAGLTDWMDFAITPAVTHNFCHGKKHFAFTDISVGFDFQLLVDTDDNYLPGLKLGLREVFPVGKYDHLNPKLYMTDVSGVGAYQTFIFLCAGRAFDFHNDHWLKLRLALEYRPPSRSHVHGFNVFGGAEDTNAYVYVSQLWNLDFAFEFTLNKNWVIACDAVAGYETPRKFKGYPGRLITGDLADLSRSDSFFFWLAPAIEYNWSDMLGFITGAWFSVAGRNADAFASWVSAINIVF